MLNINTILNNTGKVKKVDENFGSNNEQKFWFAYLYFAFFSLFLCYFFVFLFVVIFYYCYYLVLFLVYLVWLFVVDDVFLYIRFSVY